MHPQAFIDSTVNPKVKTMEEKKLGHTPWLATFWGYKGMLMRARALRWGLGRLTSDSIVHTDLHKPNNKLVNA
jgi:hypothetical protein